MEPQQVLEAVKVIEAIKPLFVERHNQWLPVIGAIGGALVGAIAAFFPTYLIEAVRERKQSAAITRALIAEIRALLVIIEHRRYLSLIEEIVHYLKENPQVPYHAATVGVPDHYSRIYQAHAKSIGLVKPDLAAKIIEFHQLIDAVVQDISEGGTFSQEGGTIEAYSQAIKILETAIEIGRDLTRIR